MKLEKNILNFLIYIVSFKKTLASLTFFLVLILSIEENLSDFSNCLADDRYVNIGTGSHSGIYFPAGSAICKIINRERNESNLRCSAETSQGSESNIQALINKQIDFAIVQSNILDYVYNGLADYKSKGANNNLRAVFSLHDDAFTLITKKDSHFKTLADIKGKKINIGISGLTSRALIDLVHEAYGWRKENFENMVDIKPTELVDGLCSNKFDVVIYNVGHPNSIIQEAATICDINFIPVTGDKIKSLTQQYPFLVETVIPGGNYIGNPSDTKTFGVKATLITLSSTDQDIVYKLVKIIFNNIESFKNLHPVFANLTTKKIAQDAITIPLHMGAATYYKEQGILP